VDLVIVVTAPVESRRSRLIEQREMEPDDILARMSAQASEADLIEAADIVVSNDGSPEDLAAKADEVWQQLVARNQR
jgi:dephospho-CoA kinase